MAIVNLFNNALTVQESKKIILARGVYLQSKGMNYSGYYYDTLRDEASDASLTLIVPALMRQRLTSNKTITLQGYITRRVVPNGGRIELHLNITELIEQTHNKYTNEEVRALEILQEKVAAGYRDVSSFIKSRIVKDEPINIAILIGRNAIIDEDIKHQLRESIGEYNIHFERINLSSESSILDALRKYDHEEVDIVVLARGGGDNLDIFNKTAIAEACIELQPYFLSAIGHKEDTTLVQKVADKAFITPSELGQYFNDLYNNTRQDLEHSKARLIEDIKKQLEVNYKQKITILNDQLKAEKGLKEIGEEGMKKAYDERILTLTNQITTLKESHRTEVAGLAWQNAAKMEVIERYKEEMQNIEQAGPKVNWLAIIIAIIGGIIIGWLLRK